MMSVLGQMSGVTGVVSILYGVLGFAITQDSSNWFFRCLIGFGILCLLYCTVAWIGHANKSGGIKKALKSKDNSRAAGGAVFVIFVLCIIALLNVLSQRRFNWQKDFTKNKVHVLSDQSKKQLANLKDVVNVTVFMQNSNEKKESLKATLKKYATQSDKFKYAFFDIDKEKIKAQSLNAQEGDIVIEYQGQRHKTQDISEQGITKSLLKVARGKESSVCFTQGHGELGFDAGNDDPRSLSFIKIGLENEGFKARALKQLTPQIDAAACDVVAIAGPQSAFTQAETSSIEAYLNQGGQVIAMLDPNTTQLSQSATSVSLKKNGLEDMLAKWGVVLGNDVLLEKFLGAQITPTVRAYAYADHPVVKPLKEEGTPAVFDRIRSVSVVKKEGLTATELAFSSEGEGSWAQTDLKALFIEQKPVIKQTDKVGEVPLGVAVEKNIAVSEGEQSKSAKLIVWGDSDCISNNMVASYNFNADLFLNSLNWMRGQVEQISIRPKLFESSAIELTPKQSNMIFYISIILLPMLVLLFGINLWLYRKRHG